MITQLRSTVADLLESQHLLDVWEYVPADVTAYPCIVVGRTSMTPSVESRVVADVSLDVYVCGHPQSDDAQDELDKNADAVWKILGGTTGRRYHDLSLSVSAITPQVIAVAGNQNCPAYALTVESAISTCSGG